MATGKKEKNQIINTCFFSVSSYEQQLIINQNPCNNNIKYTSNKLSIKSINTAANCQAISIFSRDKCCKTIMMNLKVMNWDM